MANKRICNYFAAGRCNRGNGCSFAHVSAPHGGASVSVFIPPPPTASISSGMYIPSAIPRSGTNPNGGLFVPGGRGGRGGASIQGHVYSGGRGGRGRGRGRGGRGGFQQQFSSSTSAPVSTASTSAMTWADRVKTSSSSSSSSSAAQDSASTQNLEEDAYTGYANKSSAAASANSKTGSAAATTNSNNNSNSSNNSNSNSNNNANSNNNSNTNNNSTSPSNNSNNSNPATNSDSYDEKKMASKIAVIARSNNSSEYSLKDFETPRVFVISNLTTANEMVAKYFLNNNNNSLCGFDCESPTNSASAALVQLCNENAILLIRLSAMGKIPENVFKLLAKPNVLKCGIGIESDIESLRAFANQPVNSASLLNIDSVFRLLDDHAAPGLQNLSKDYLNLQLDKIMSVRASDWSIQNLSLAQIHFAALDVFVHYRLGAYLRARLPQPTNPSAVVPQTPPNTTNVDNWTGPNDAASNVAPVQVSVSQSPPAAPSGAGPHTHTAVATSSQGLQQPQENWHYQQQHRYAQSADAASTTYIPQTSATHAPAANPAGAETDEQYARHMHQHHAHLQPTPFVHGFPPMMASPIQPGGWQQPFFQHDGQVFAPATWPALAPVLSMDGQYPTQGQTANQRPYN